ncbi:hypothetical protein AO1008_07434 [Aspergillus oryzae 100-8]|uniref:SET domain-containing protein n=1 Tax=Aspergillus oryzae (strain 3.042) TaxID=1160506 RepID=I8U3Y5_ASPO3|nr:hypothetical protein Ao3042_01964 [Aspergillus oryzae 3.042]KDE80550.1 hypothetical protein AO1008_07434 [Aspergillus oryzae 100-8]|eukprot:EIT81510.1 hypothetical protein Ao3042_01964 [Aspergillus oryzae 3.042]
MSSTIHFHDPANFQSQSDEFISWLSGKPGVKVNPKIRLADLRSRAAGRGVELQELQGSAIVDRIGKEGAEESILEIIAPIVRANPSLFPPVDGLASYDGDAGTQALLNLAHVMGSLIMAYAFDIEKPEDEDDEGDDESGYVTDDEEQLSKGMVPLADLLNADADQNNARLFQEETGLVMKAIKPISAGAEIFNDYGEIPRADLLRRRQALKMPILRTNLWYILSISPIPV